MQYRIGTLYSSHNIELSRYIYSFRNSDCMNRHSNYKCIQYIRHGYSSHPPMLLLEYIQKLRLLYAH